MRILITGITGFVGSHMADYLLENVPDVKIFATRRWRSKEDNIKHLFGNEQVVLEECVLHLLDVQVLLLISNHLLYMH